MFTASNKLYTAKKEAYKYDLFSLFPLNYLLVSHRIISRRPAEIRRIFSFYNNKVYAWQGRWIFWWLLFFCTLKNFRCWVEVYGYKDIQEETTAFSSRVSILKVWTQLNLFQFFEFFFLNVFFIIQNVNKRNL